MSYLRDNEQVNSFHLPFFYYFNSVTESFIIFIETNNICVFQKIFDYASSDGQQLLFEYHNSFSHVDNIIKNDDGSLPDFWLTMFRTWLIGIYYK